ncbi:MULTISPECIES: hypothetical protein [unclassified Plantactinospora]|uniref:hypothetical protein n=1 Tax=unclassified Plantactinospora TaxID=2631981 RepID=UPI000D165547|nr:MULTISPECIES: hypothetical protein [unclassified Plantactinospora]AVT30451.1 hypothetical protein C6361_14195 [Plantactinospora sp. BC1]AVT36903.1 hypothetical protein C6W10_10960 [Plantactinospora sp. BB1]
MMQEPPRPGMVVQVGAAASVQFGGRRAMLFRVTRVSEKPTYHGWCWLTGYSLDEYGNAVRRREIYVQLAGLQPVHWRPAQRARVATPPRRRSQPVRRANPKPRRLPAALI